MKKESKTSEISGKENIKIVKKNQEHFGITFGISIFSTIKDLSYCDTLTVIHLKQFILHVHLVLTDYWRTTSSGQVPFLASTL